MCLRAWSWVLLRELWPLASLVLADKTSMVVRLVVSLVSVGERTTTWRGGNSATHLTLARKSFQGIFRLSKGTVQ